MRNGIVHHKSDRKSCVLPTADRTTMSDLSAFLVQIQQQARHMK